MDYIAVHFTLAPVNETVSDVLAALLADPGFESFSAVLMGCWLTCQPLVSMNSK